MTRAACSSLWSGSRTDSPEKASTPMDLPSDVTAKVSTPRMPAPSATDFVDARMSRCRSPDQAAPNCHTTRERSRKRSTAGSLTHQPCWKLSAPLDSSRR